MPTDAADLQKRHFTLSLDLLGIASAHLIESQLSSSGYEAIRCEQPRRVRDLAAKLQSDALTLDLLMKPVHGIQVLLELNDDPRTAKIPVIVVTIGRG